MDGMVILGTVAPAIENEGTRVIDGIPALHTIDDARFTAEVYDGVAGILGADKPE